MLSVEILQKMTQRFNQFNMLMLVVVVLIVAGGHMLNNHTQSFLGCASKQEWNVVKLPGRAFEIAHIAIILIGAV